jgi:hypothetical protein
VLSRASIHHRRIRVPLNFRRVAVRDVRRTDGCGDGHVLIGNALSRGPWSLTSNGHLVGRGSGQQVQLAGAVQITIKGEEIELQLPRGTPFDFKMTFSSQR